MTKKVITVEDILELEKQGKKSLSCDKATIITALAQDKAKELGIKFCNEGDVAQPKADINIHTQIKKHVLEQLPKELHHSSLVDNLIEKLLKETQQNTTPKIQKTTKIQEVECDSLGRGYLDGVIAIDTKKMTFGKFDDAPCNEEIRIVDVITDKDNSPMGVGYLEWDNASFDWHLDYDEVDIILEGELHVIINGREVIGKAGDCIFIPKNTSITFSAPSKVKFAYVTYPANWG